MTISTATSRVAYTGDGSTRIFSIPFFFQTTGDIVVYLQDLTGATFLQSLSTDYVLVGTGLVGGGTATFTVAPQAGWLVSIYRDPALTQTTSYNNNDPFPAKSHEAALDKGCTIDQRTRDIALRSLHLPDAESSLTVTALASVALRKNRFLAFDSNGSVVYAVGPTFVNSTATGVADVDSKATAQITVFPISVNVIQTHGGVTFGDGGGQDYIRGTIASPTPFQDGGGNYWTPATVQAAIAWANLTGVPPLIAAPASIWDTGDVKLTLKTVAPPLWVMFDDGTFGNAVSGSSGRNNADTQALFTLLYASPFTDSSCPILTSAGSATTRVAQGSAATAYGAGCRMSLLKVLGRALAMGGAGAGITARTVGTVVGTDTSTLSTSNLPAYTPTGTVTNGAITAGAITNGAVTPSQNDFITLTPFGGLGIVGSSGLGTSSGRAVSFNQATSTAANPTQATTTFAGGAQGGTAVPISIMQPTVYMNVMVKL